MTFPFSDISKTLNIFKIKNTEVPLPEKTLLLMKILSTDESRFASSLQELQEQHPQQQDLQECDLPCLAVSRKNKRRALLGEKSH